MLVPTTASVSKIERELPKQNDVFGPGGETSAVTTDIQPKLLKQGIRAGVVIVAVGSGKDGLPSPWLQKRLDAFAQRSGAPTNEPLAELKSFIAKIQRREEKTMSLSLEQFDGRVSRANKSMDRLETMVDSGAERQAVEEMRKEISALFAEQRRDIEMQQVRSLTEAAGTGGAPPVVPLVQRRNGQPQPRARRPNNASRFSGRPRRNASAAMIAMARNGRLDTTRP